MVIQTWKSWTFSLENIMLLTLVAYALCKTKGKKTMNLNLNELLMQLSLPFHHLRSQPYQDLEHQLHYEQQRLTF